MKFPRDMDAPDLIKALRRIGYVVVRQSGSHVRLRCDDPASPHSVTVPNHSPLRLGTLATILADVGAARGLSRDSLLGQLID